MPIIIDEQSGVLVGGHGSHLAGECDTILHAFAPLGYKSWKQIPLQDRETLIEQLKDNFILDTTRPSVKRFLNYRMSKGYANFKHKMLMHFRNYATIEEARGNPFGNILPENWSSLCDLFAMESIENIKKRRIRHENFKASRGFICKFQGWKRLQGHMLQVLREDRNKLYIEQMEIEGASASLMQHPLSMVLDPAVAPTNEDP
ncbi:hypothetical protein MKW98_008333 [Papaver atlanticum]|uniref:Uncharacterized protein n=1 Tax=Papaver atlanticum TaxID=357466 RepID=A0AAD4SNZ8_9MAGN|nr:hypothetical protein MKW98_008333 [Papaver atlanticum]